MKKTIFILGFLLLLIVNSNAQCDPNPGTVVISEIYFDTHFSEEEGYRYHNYGEYIELYNSSDQDINLSEWYIKDNRTYYKFNQGEIIPKNGFKIITYSDKDPELARANLAAFFPILETHKSDIIVQSSMVLFNNMERIRLYNPYDRLIDEVSYWNKDVSWHASNDPKTYLGMPLSTNFTININGAIDNGDGGVFWGEIGYKTDEQGNTLPEFHPEFLQSIHRGLDQQPIVENFYKGGGITFGIANASPLELPVVVPNKEIDPYLYLAPTVDESFNMTESISYDIRSLRVIGQSKSYFDELGKNMVSLTKDFKSGLIWGTETLYDSFGRKSKESFPAVTICSSFEKINFLSDPAIKLGTLELYYSNSYSNPFNEFQATATHPFSEINYDTLNPGNIINVVGGNQVNVGVNLEWKTGYTYTVPAAQEMYYIYGYDFFDGPITSGQEEVITKYSKTVSIDANGVENVAFTDGEGKTLATARAGGSITYPVISLIGTQGFVDIHIPSTAPDGVLIGAATDYTIFDLKTGLTFQTSGSLPSGHAYRVVANTIPMSDPKVYVNITTGLPEVDPTANALGVTYKVNYYDYSIYIYNKTGQLTKNIQPEGFSQVFNQPLNNPFIIKPSQSYMTGANFSSTFTYNDQGQVKETTSSDEGLSKFAYRQDGQIRYSQSAVQAPLNKVSYNNYDAYARPIESGIITGNSTTWNTVSTYPDDDYYSGVFSEQVCTIYDYPENNLTSVPIPFALSLNELLDDQGLNLLNYNQKNLSGNVAVTFTKPDATITAITWYSYDIYGRVEWLVQYNEMLGVKTIHYNYDYKGNVVNAIYQKDNPSEYFAHHYTYDINNVLEKAATSTATTRTNQVEYSYYVTGELKRVELLPIAQGTDYVYTLGGMLKSINHPSLTAADDPGGDDNGLFGETLDYYPGDYIRSGKNFTASSTVTPDYNGNISVVRFTNKNKDVLNLNDPISVTNLANPKAYSYQYDRNNWLTGANFGTLPYSGTGNITANGDFKESGITYDANGNIKSLERSTEMGTLTDILDYKYSTTNNQLNSVVDNGAATADPTDLEGTTSYHYNAIGQLDHAIQDDLYYFYNAQGLVTEVRKGLNMPLVKFYYNERGHRIKKETFNTSIAGALVSTEFSVLDVSGNIMAIYTKDISSPIVMHELPIYGLDRIGTYYKGDDKTAYEIKDHLGNVRVVIMHKPTSNSIDSYADYYPFGEKILSRSSNTYRFAFQGQQLDLETGMEAFQLRLWDGRIGRWLTTDPAYAHFSPYLGMGNNPVSDIDPDGGCPCSVCPENCLGSGANPSTDADNIYPQTSGIQELQEVVISSTRVSGGKRNIGLDLSYKFNSPIFNFPLAPRIGDDWWWNKLAISGKRYIEYNGFQYLLNDAGFAVKNLGPVPQGGTISVGPAGGFNVLKSLKPKEIIKLGKDLRNIIKKGKAPKGVDRVDIPKLDPLGKPIHNQKVHLHLKDGRALNLDGTWKHGEGEVSNKILDWIISFIN